MIVEPCLTRKTLSWLRSGVNGGEVCSRYFLSKGKRKEEPNVFLFCVGKWILLLSCPHDSYKGNVSNIRRFRFWIAKTVCVHSINNYWVLRTGTTQQDSKFKSLFSYLKRNVDLNFDCWYFLYLSFSLFLYFWFRIS